MKKNLDNKEEMTHRRDKEWKALEKHERVIEYLKTTLNQEDNREIVCSTHLSLLPPE
jgi:hypothetical protein